MSWISYYIGILFDPSAQNAPYLYQTKIPVEFYVFTQRLQTSDNLYGASSAIGILINLYLIALVSYWIDILFHPNAKNAVTYTTNRIFMEFCVLT